MNAARKKVSVPQLAEEWGVGTKKIAGFIRSGELRAIDISTSRDKRPRYLIDLADIKAFEAARAVIPDGGERTTRRLRRPVTNVRKFF